MTKVRKQKRKKRFRVNVNRKRLRNKQNKLPKIECEEIESSWELKRSIRTNLKDMGLAYDPNEVLKIPSTKRNIIKANDDENEAADKAPEDSKRQKIHVANKLEAEAKAPRERLFRLPKSQVQFITYLMEKYGDDYKAMARDRKNHYQMTWCQIRAKINTFKSIPEQYAEYLLKSGEIVLDDPTPLEETRRKIGEENVRKFCAPKKRTIVTKEAKPSWDVDSFLEDESREDLLSDIKDGSKDRSDNGAKKLKLFSEDESSGDEGERDSKNKIKGGLRTRNKKLVKPNEDSNKKLKSNEVNKKPDADTRLLLKPKQIEDGNSKKDVNTVESSKKLRKNQAAAVQKSNSSDSDSGDNDEELDGDSQADGFVNLSDMSDEELSEDDVLDDGEFVTDSDEDE